MTPRILILEFYDDFEAQYRLSRAYLDDKYHNQGTHLRPIPAADDGMYNTDAPQHRQHSTTPNGKKVI
jgi:hypothetical protein